MMSPEVVQLLREGIAALGGKNYLEAERNFRLAELINSDNCLIRIKVGTIYAQHGDFEQAKKYLLEALALEPNNITISYNLGLVFAMENNNEEALHYYDLAIKTDPNNIETLINKALVLNELKRYEEAIVTINSVIRLNPNIAEAWSNLGVSYRHLSRYAESLDSYNRALQLNPKLPTTLFNKGLVLNLLKQFSEAFECFKAFIQIQPNHAQGWLYLAHAQEELNLLNEALRSYDEGLRLDPSYPEAWSNRGNLLGKLSRQEEAIPSYDNAINLRPEYCSPWVNKGHTLFELNKHKEALQCYQKAFEIDPNFDYLIGALVHSMMRMCDWIKSDRLTKKIFSESSKNKKLISPFFILGLTDRLTLQKKAAEIYAENTGPKEALPLLSPRNNDDNKIRLGYLSADFCMHPVAILTAEIFELHDRNRFEVYGFSSKKNNADKMQQRLRASFDQFIDVDTLSDIEIANKFRSMKIDIAIDLGGFTNGSRTRALAYRAAPIQINYLGFPGTMGSSYIDYIIGDQVVIPENLKDSYSEKIIYLPNSYQANDSKRKISEIVFSRQDFSLPEGAFVFCCFNSPYKITQQSFSSWLMILKESPSSVLWLLEDEIDISYNLRSEAEKKGINPNRLIFTGRLPQEEYLARYRLADLFLDTHPFNAGTTASDALWSGLPVLTYPGEAFASRMASSLLSALNLPELIANSEQDYINLAVEFANIPGKTLLVRDRLASNRLSSPLFDSQLFTKHLESGLTQAHERYCNNLVAADIKINP
ncbi:tetratricopeptide repeat protein [Polynucleobacter sp. CS-Odin-A6]|uniref:tetratricopeptide repeat protein n=1 Tax=Polynucleobacter sp. CS-Odin-A6 TaxID=2689106 RepID=UPI001C0C82FA|nr:tetratricopeptide repeat protein [Polynucleobacter sp. CS-Odin-A6]MBU3621308.1 tetratricopeptide repeat protein [Polynucleobacter sp. CS-Odin-A6]